MATTLQECQTLVTSISSLLAKYVYEESRAARFVLLEYKSTVVSNGGTATLDQVDGAGAQQTLVLNDQTALTPSIAVARANASTDYLKRILRPLAVTLAGQLDDLVTGLYSSFTTNAPIGTAGVALTETNFVAARNALSTQAPASDPITIFLAQSALSSVGMMTPLIDVAKGGPAALANILKGQPGAFRGMTVSGCSKVRLTGSAPVTTNNLAVSKSAVVSASSAQTLVNDGSNVQAMSVSDAIGVFVGLAYTGGDDQTVTLRVRSNAKILVNAWGVQVKS